MYWPHFWIRFRIFRHLMLRYFCPWDIYFLDSIVFDIWYLARYAEDLADMPNVGLIPGMELNDSDHEALLLDDDEQMDPELSAALATARKPAADVKTGGIRSACVKGRDTKVKFTVRSVSISVSFDFILFLVIEFVVTAFIRQEDFLKKDVNCTSLDYSCSRNVPFKKWGRYLLHF